MEKGEIVKRINGIISTLKSNEIIDYLNQWQIDKVHLLKLIVESKIGFDQAMADKKNEQIFKEFEESKVYSLNYYSDLIMFISNISDTNRSTLQSNNTLHNFYLFHKILSKTCTIILNLVSDETAVEKEVERTIEKTVDVKEPVKANVITERVMDAKKGGKLLQIPKEEEEQDVTLGKFLKSLASY
jgi:hypothetical protein